MVDRGSDVGELGAGASPLFGLVLVAEALPERQHV